MHAIGWMNEWMEEDPIKGMQSERALELLVFQSVMQESGIRNQESGMSACCTIDSYVVNILICTRQVR